MEMDILYVYHPEFEDFRHMHVEESQSLPSVAFYFLFFWKKNISIQDFVVLLSIGRVNDQDRVV